MHIKAILFDAFGTLCEIAKKRNPYKPIIEAWPSGVADAYQVLMTRDCSPVDLAKEAGCSDEIIQQIGADIQTEIASMHLFQDVPALLETLKKRGIKWGIVSNLTTPYAGPLLNLLPFVPDVCAWSFAVGYRKPEDGIYGYACKALGVVSSAVLMVGDPLKNDYDAPKRIGIQAKYLLRSGDRKTGQDTITDFMGILQYLD